MKRLVIYALCIVTVFFIAACGNTQTTPTSSVKASSIEPTAVFLPSTSSDQDNRLITDSAKLLSENEISSLAQRVNEASSKYRVDIALATIERLPDSYSGMEEYANKLYDFQKYGFGYDRDGMLLVICMDPRRWQITTSGSCIKAFPEAKINYIGEQIKPYLQEGKFSEAFLKYVEIAESTIKESK